MSEAETTLHRIIVDPAILVGKPVVRGTRVPVELVLEYLAQDPDPQRVLAAFPRLTIEDVKACLAYAEALVRGEEILPLDFERGKSHASA